MTIINISDLQHDIIELSENDSSNIIGGKGGWGSKLKEGFRDALQGVSDGFSSTHRRESNLNYLSAHAITSGVGAIAGAVGSLKK